MINLIKDATFQTILLDDGNVEFKFLDNGKEIFAAICTPEQVGTLATGMLSAASASFLFSDKQSTCRQPTLGWKKQYRLETGVLATQKLKVKKRLLFKSARQQLDSLFKRQRCAA